LKGEGGLIFKVEYTEKRGEIIMEGNEEKAEIWKAAFTF